jgi:hypothetical protein
MNEAARPGALRTHGIGKLQRSSPALRPDERHKFHIPANRDLA